MAKMGRPKQKITKKKSIGVRLSDQEYEILMQYATSHKLSITKVVQCALEQFFKGNQYRYKISFLDNGKENVWQKQEKIIKAEHYAKEKSSGRKMDDMCIHTQIQLASDVTFMQTH